MPAAVLVVHDEPNTRELAVTALRAVFLDVIGFDDPMAALNAIEDDTRVRVLVTRVAFGLGKLNGVALASATRIRAGPTAAPWRSFWLGATPPEWRPSRLCSRFTSRPG
jgi:DNA-binding NtrC family response regulator